MSEVYMNTKLAPWTVPNFVCVEMPPRPRQEGMAESPKYAIAELGAEVLSDMCDRFRADVFAKAGKADPRLSHD